MTSQLLAITIGPVQELIVAARRTRDLWFGSYLLSEISKAAARALQDQGVTLIFPAPGSPADLAPDSSTNVANVIIGEIKDTDPEALAQTAKAAARACWRSFADRVHATHAAVIDLEIWKDQVDDIVEFYAAWSGYTPATYQADRAALMRMLQARKQCRDFVPGRGRAGVWKSSLDGLRESVLLPSGRWPVKSRRRFHLSEGEQLDVLGAVKRVWTPVAAQARYPSVARVAADPWLRGLAPFELTRLVRACGALVDKFDGDLLHEIDVSPERGHSHYAHFPFEGTAVYRSRYRDLATEAEVPLAELDPVAHEITALSRYRGEPSPYLAVVLADGDRMGQAIARIGSADAHRAFSRDLARFAGSARRIFDDHRGVLIYAGGDDVLGLVPVDRCVAAARALRDRFGQALAPWSERTATELTLSVGVAIAHFMEPFEDLLGYARDAERHAKTPRHRDGDQPDRDGLALHVVKRGGEALEVRAPWSSRPEHHWSQLATWFAERSVPGRAAHDLHAIAGVYDRWPAPSVADAIRADAIARLHGKRPAGTNRMAEIEAMVRDRVTSADTLRALANELLVAQQLAAAARQASAATVTPEAT